VSAKDMGQVPSEAAAGRKPASRKGKTEKKELKGKKM